MTDLPAYLHDLSRASLRNDTQVDKDVVRHLMSVSILFANLFYKLEQIDQRIKKSFDEVCKDITEKKPIDYVGSYELIKHDKLKRGCFAGLKDGERKAKLAADKESFYSVDNPSSWKGGIKQNK